MMESIYNKIGWEWILSAHQPYSLNQRVRLLHKLQNAGEENILTSLFNERTLTHYRNDKYPNIYSTRAMELWKAPEKWPNLNVLTNDKKYVIWSMYALVNNREQLLELAKQFNWNTFISEQTFKPNSDYYSLKYKERLTYIKTFIENINTITKNSKLAIELPVFDCNIN